MEESRNKIQAYFSHWRNTELAKMLCPNGASSFKEVAITRYSDYPMLDEFRRRIADATKSTPRQEGELSKAYFDRVGQPIGRSLEGYLVEPYFLCMRSTGTTGQNKWLIDGETFWNNFVLGVNATAVIACSDGWGETKLEEGDTGLNISASVPTLSGWALLAAQKHLRLLPPNGGHGKTEGHETDLRPSTETHPKRREVGPCWRCRRFVLHDM